MYKGVGPPLRLVGYTLIHNDHSAMRRKKRLYTETSPFQFRCRVQCQERLGGGGKTIHRDNHTLLSPLSNDSPPKNGNKNTN